MSQLKQVHKEGIFGVSGSGKDAYGTSLVERAAVYYNRDFVVLAPSYEHIGLAEIPTAYFVLIDTDRAMRLRERGLLALFDKFPQVVFGKYRCEREQFIEFENRVCRVLFDSPDLWNTLLYVSEVEDIAPEGADRTDNPFLDIVTQGRKLGLDVIANAQRTARVDKDFVSQCNMLTCFHLHEENDLAHLRPYFGEYIDPKTQTKLGIETLRDLAIPDPALPEKSRKSEYLQYNLFDHTITRHEFRISDRMTQHLG